MLFLTEFVDTKHFNLSKENYHDRKRDAEARVQAVIDFVSNDEECRSVQLLRYFNERTNKVCGRCDVCRKQGAQPVPYATIEQRLESIVSESSESVESVVTQCGDVDEAEVLDSIRFLIDSGVLKLDKEGRLSQNKKSRQ